MYIYLGIQPKTLKKVYVDEKWYDYASEVITIHTWLKKTFLKDCILNNKPIQIEERYLKASSPFITLDQPYLTIVYDTKVKYE